jgi:hypothetical protein
LSKYPDFLILKKKRVFMPEPLPPTPPSGQPIGPKKTSPEQDVTIPWQKFLSQGGNIASKQEAKLFIGGLLKFFNTLVAHERARIAKANEHLKRVIKGEE